MLSSSAFATPHTLRLMYSYRSGGFAMFRANNNNWLDALEAGEKADVKGVQLFLGPAHRMVEVEVLDAGKADGTVHLELEGGQIFTLPSLTDDAALPALSRMTGEGQIAGLDEYEYLVVDEQAIRDSISTIEIPPRDPKDLRTLNEVFICEGVVRNAPPRRPIGFTSGFFKRFGKKK